MRLADNGCRILWALVELNFNLTTIALHLTLEGEPLLRAILHDV